VVTPTYPNKSFFSSLPHGMKGKLQEVASFARRLVAVADGGGKFDSHLALGEVPLVGLVEAMNPLINYVPHVMEHCTASKSWVGVRWKVCLPYHLTVDEAAAIHLYTREWQKRVCHLSFFLLQGSNFVLDVSPSRMCHSGAH
jgi:hypothetical protein